MNFRSLTDWWLEVHVLVYGEKSRGERTQPWVDPVLIVSESDMFPQLHALPLVRHDVCDPPAGGVCS